MGRPAVFLFLLLATLAGAPDSPADVDKGVIRLSTPSTPNATVEEPEEVELSEPRQGFDYGSFESRLESLWFQRKTFLSDGRVEDAKLQLERIRAFSMEEGVHRLEHLAGALLSEARRNLREGNRQQTLSALHFAESFDPGRPQIHLARAAANWKFGEGIVASALELVKAVRAAWIRGAQNLSLLHQVAFAICLALIGSVVTFSILMLVRYQVPFRHEVEEGVAQFADGSWCKLAGWSALSLPLLVWYGAGWAAIYWIVITFRFMTRGERLTAASLLLATTMTVPVYNVSIALYGTTADPAVRATLASVGGEYDPDRIVKLRQLVDAHPEDPVYRFLLADLYTTGRYFEEAFQEYKRALQLEPDLVSAHINIGNIFYTTGQFPAAVSSYKRALDQDSDSFLAYFNMHLAQSESFRFAEAEESLREARRINSDRVAALLSGEGGVGDRPVVQNATLRMASIWESAVAGRQSLHFASSPQGAPSQLLSFKLLGVGSIVSLSGLLVCLLVSWTSRGQNPARRCIRCGRPFCQHCKSGREAKEYCSQCLHLFVLGDGLEPGTKQRKLYEVERYERRAKRTRRVLSFLLPGAAHLLRGRTGCGLSLIVLWFAALIMVRPGVLRPMGWLAGIDLQPGVLLGSHPVPVAFAVDPLGLLALVLVPVLWIVGNTWRWSGREV